MNNVVTGIPINYHLHLGNSERDALREQLKYLNPDTDVLICDRGYYSNGLYDELVDLGFNVIFRLKDDLKNTN